MAEVAAAAGVGKVLLKCLLSGAKASVGADESSKQVIRRDLPYLKEELAAMQPFIRAADFEQNIYKVPRTEVIKVRTLAYDVDDCIQDATVQPEKPSRWRLPHTMRERQRIAEEMKRLRAKIEDTSQVQRSLRYQIAEDPKSKSATSATTSGARPRHTAVSASDKPEVNRMVRLINSEDSDLKVIAVWGTSGNLEQTSVVRAAYEDPDVIEKFPCRAWVRVMQPFNPIEFVQGVVRQFHAAVGVEVLLEAEKTAQQLAQEFNQHVTDNGYLIVLNDLNTIEEWDRIKTCFPNNKKGSRIIVITKQAEVASLSVGYESVELELKQLAPDQILYAFHEKDPLKLGPEIYEQSRVYLKRCCTLELSWESYLDMHATEKNYIIKFITSESTETVISVVDTCGLGKTTLVRDVYDSPELSGTFHSRAYVTIIHPFNLEELLMSLVMQLTAGRAYQDNCMVASSHWKKKTMTQVQIMDALDRLDGMRCLIVLDNVLSFEECDVIMGALCRMWSSTKIVVTTRHEYIAKYFSGNTFIFLNPLHPKDAHYLFTRKVFGNTADLDRQYPELVEQANLVLKKCSGIPLAIVSIGALLADRPKTELEWSRLNEHISAKQEMNLESMTIRTLFLTCYDYLPYHLKSCILYLPIFPEDYKVRRKRLIRRWTAEGYSNKSTDKTADSYFMELIRRSMILPCQLSIHAIEGIDLCQVNDIISQIAISKSREENLVFKLEKECKNDKEDIVRHLAVSNNWEGDQSELESKVDVSRLRSMTVFGKWRPFIGLDKMRLLRVLDLEDTSGLVDHHLEHIGKLLHLRYLSLRGCGDIYHLPDSLGNLRLLESLDVKGTKITKLPETICKLRKLQHVVAGNGGADDDDLYESMSGSVPKPMRNKLGHMAVFSAGICVACCAPDCMKEKMNMDGDVNRRDVCTVCCCTILPALATRGSIAGVAVPRGISKLKALLTLGTVNVSGRRKTALQDIAKCTWLRKLGVAGINRRNRKELCSAITHLGCLESLSVRSDGKLGLVDCLDDIASLPQKLQKLKLYGRLGRLPGWIQWLKNLVKLKLGGSCVDNEAMQVLGKLPKLAILILLKNSFEGEDLRFIFYTGTFPSLLVLQLQCLDVGGRVEFEEVATPRLEVLRFGLPSRFYGLDRLCSLREVVLGSLGRDQEYMMEDVREQLALNPNRPVLRMGN
uniref:Uncharacterized protein n=1 Tax=Avena sativa TaxID=4498 RepID=A0ACD6AE83_AVESA